MEGCLVQPAPDLADWTWRLDGGLKEVGAEVARRDGRLSGMWKLGWEVSYPASPSPVYPRPSRQDEEQCRARVGWWFMGGGPPVNPTSSGKDSRRVSNYSPTLGRTWSQGFQKKIFFFGGANFPCPSTPTEIPEVRLVLFCF